MNTIKHAFDAKCQTVYAHLVTFKADTKGSETVEKMGWILGAIVIIGIAFAALREPLRNIITNIFEQATDKLTDISG